MLRSQAGTGPVLMAKAEERASLAVGTLKHSDPVNKAMYDNTPTGPCFIRCGCTERLLVIRLGRQA